MSNDNPDTAALDLDAIRKRAVLYRANQMQHEKTYDRAAGLTAAAFLCAQDVPTLLDALAAAREELAALGTDLRISRARCASAERIMAEDSRKLTEARAGLGRAVDLMLRARHYGNLPAALCEQIDAFTVEKAEAVPAAAPQTCGDGSHVHIAGFCGPVTLVPQAAVPGDGEQAATTCPECGHNPHVGWSCSYIHRSGGMQVNSYCGCYVKHIAALPTSGQA